MKYAFATALMTVVVMGSSRPAAAEKLEANHPDDTVSIQGEWVLVSIEDGLKGHLEILKKKAIGIHFVVQSDRVAFKEDKEAVLKFKLDSSQTPKEINVRMGSYSYPGIYDLSENSLTLCIGMFPDTPRPTKLEANEDGKWAYAVLKREKH